MFTSLARHLNGQDGTVGACFFCQIMLVDLICACLVDQIIVLCSILPGEGIGLLVHVSDDCGN